MEAPTEPEGARRRLRRRTCVAGGLAVVALVTWLALASNEPPPASFWIAVGDHRCRMCDAPDGAQVDGAWRLRDVPSDHAGAVGHIGPRPSLVRQWVTRLRAWGSGQPTPGFELVDELRSPDRLPFVVLHADHRAGPVTWRFCVTGVAGLPEPGRCPPELVGTWDREPANGISTLELRADGTFTAPPYVRVPEGRWGVSDRHVLFESSSPPADPRWRFSVALWEPEQRTLTRIDVGTESYPNEVYRRR